MSLSERFKSMMNKGKGLSDKKEGNLPNTSDSSPASQPKPGTSSTLEGIGQWMAKERAEGLEKQQALDKDLRATREALEKLELNAKTARDTHNQTLEFLRQDADREIKFFERKLREDMTLWDKQLKDREKS